MKKSEIKNILYITSIALIIFIVTFSILSFLGLAPKSLTFFAKEKNIIKNQSEIINMNNESYTRPDRVVIPKVGVDSFIEKPNSVDVATLDNALTKGAVHYPGSGSLEQGNMFIFGHSTNWQVVQNQAYKTFNGIENLVPGDEIEMYSGDKTYIYKVNSVILVDQDDALVEFDNSNRILTISTCNTFGEKQERWVVEAEFYKEV